MAATLDILKMTKPQLADFLIEHGTIYPNRAGLLKWSKDDLVNSALDHVERAHSEMAEAMNREPDPATDNGYGPRAVND